MGGDKRTDWVTWCTLTMKSMLLIEYYPTRMGRLPCWRDEAWRTRVALHYVGLKNPGLQNHFDELLAESWQLSRERAITVMARYDAGGGTGTILWCRNRRSAGDPVFRRNAPIAGRRSLASAEPSPGRILPGLNRSRTGGL